MTPKPFDAPDAPSPLQACGTFVATRPGVFAALVVATSLALLAAAGVGIATAFVRADAAAMLRATGVVVLVDDAATADDARALGALLRSIPGVADASFRAKDDALKDLAARGLPAPDGRNPLPDTWTLRLAGGDDVLPGERAAAAARAATHLEHVASTRVDPRWFAALDRATQWRRVLLEPVRTLALAALATGLFCLGVAGGGTVARSFDAATGSPKWALAVVIVVILLSSTALTAVALALFAGGADRWLPGDRETVARLVDVAKTGISAAFVATTLGGAALALGLGTLLGSPSER